jgi:superoxide dismutase, Fe-Mn family
MQVHTAPRTIQAKKWNLSGLAGISDGTLEMHFGLYEGYVKNTNLLFERLQDLRDKDRAEGSNPAYAELVRRLGWEYNGVRLHELYFNNLTKSPAPIGSSQLYQLIGESFGGYDEWKKDFMAVGGMRGIGWAIAYYDRAARWITNHWINDHESGHIAGSIPVLVLDVWEHAYIKDYKPSEKAKYVEAFFKHIDWRACEERLR